MKALVLADVIGDFDTHNGLRITDVGEDGDVLIAGHHDEEQTWLAWQEHSGYEPGDRDYWDLEQRWAAFSDHSEGCELEDCGCLDEHCDPCREGQHAECAGDDDCICGTDTDHVDPSCTCTCNCDEYAWWVSSVKEGHGDPVTWITYSWTKNRARSGATTSKEADRA